MSVVQVGETAERFLGSLALGAEGRIRGAELEPRDAAMVRAMGLRPGAVVRVCRVGEPFIVEIVSGGKECPCGVCRIGLGRGLAQRIQIEAP